MALAYYMIFEKGHRPDLRRALTKRSGVQGAIDQFSSGTLPFLPKPASERGEVGAGAGLEAEPVSGVEQFGLDEADALAQRSWTDMVAQVGSMTLFPKAESWYMGANIPGKPRQLINFPSVCGYAAMCHEVAGHDYRGFIKTTLSGTEDAPR